MAIKTSGALAFTEIQAEFGGSAPISLNEYYNVDTNVPVSGTIAVSNFYGRSKGLVASYNAIVSYTIPSGAGGVGEGFYRTAASWYNSYDRKGTVRLWGNVSVGSKIGGYQLYVDGVVVSSYPLIYRGPTYFTWDVSAAVDRGSYVYLSCYGWGAYGNDSVRSGAFYVGAG